MNKYISPDLLKEAEEVLIHLAAGVIYQEEKLKQHTYKPVTELEPSLQRAWDRLTLFCYTQEADPPKHFPELIEWLHCPVEKWEGVGDIFKELQLSGSILFYGSPTELCIELGKDYVGSSDLEREIQDRPMKEILKYCYDNYLVDEYSKARRFLVENPFLTRGIPEILDYYNWDSKIQSLLIQCYQPIPPICLRYDKQQKYIALCPRCGWALEWKNNQYAQCYSDLCGRIINIHDATFLECPQEAMRTIRGIQYSTVGPEKPLLNLYNLLTEKLKLNVELWPEIDLFDLYIEFPDGEFWAVDMKDIFNPRNLARIENRKEKSFSTVLLWEKAFFVFPTYRRKPGYLEVFKQTWKGQENCDAIFVDDFIKQVKERLKHA
ncbi:MULTISPECIES: hypothetical protein [Thermoactinomyces]|uniref:REase associating with pPIWI RE domain-containing protein n=1 Tax=Thermoactinomyces intermedius TaxID=2024 RepID=A0A8I1AGC7_THEIN|nr:MULTISPECIES: hypothetical protein [Thermoactinomyces]KYQ87954.1 hypothetical protein AYX07_04590 [Thermoactinomyces sp. AS95]MBA4549079.1 hypothetical protein [Thermoactinomyces intermedius]MBA4835512.1 hypothetical protein [Thermoactinomyces intermedius]MBH8584780.1 hypothetical protein [Thermoactinomyces sp. CICC 10520]MBH8595488.1 hypothetical protein [Thermoactinomyces intermedius]